MQRGNKRAVAVLLAALLLTGCAARGAQTSSEKDIVIIDAGQHSSISELVLPDRGAESESAPDDISSPDEASRESFAASEEPSPRDEDISEEISVPAHTSSSTVNTTASSAATSAPEETHVPEEAPAPEVITPTEESPAPETVKPTAPTEESPIQTEEVYSEKEAAEPTEEAPSQSASEYGTNSYNALNHDEVQGVWISYLELAELLRGKSGAEFRNNIAAALDNCRSIGLNTVYIHVRSHSDAYYESELFPWSKYVTGTLDKAPDFDPLDIVTEEAHSRGISVQAWINPLRACSTSEMESYGDHQIYRWYSAGKYVKSVSGYYYLDPAYDEVRELIAAGAAEIVSRYDVDGLHIDDYFYPTTDASFDSAAFAQSGYSVLSDFRFANCDRLVSGIYSAVKKANPTALFSVSCQGSIENNYNLMYADVEKWCTESGYLDYIVPQIYYGFDNSTQPYERCLSEWEAFAARGGIPLVVGLSVSKIGYEDKWAGEGKSEWLTDSDIISRQVMEAMECTSYGGAALYSYKSIFMADSAVSAQVDREIKRYSQTITAG